MNNPKTAEYLEAERLRLQALNPNKDRIEVLRSEVKERLVELSSLVTDEEKALNLTTVLTQMAENDQSVKSMSIDKLGEFVLDNIASDMSVSSLEYSALMEVLERAGFKV